LYLTRFYKSYRIFFSAIGGYGGKPNRRGSGLPHSGNYMEKRPLGRFEQFSLPLPQQTKDKEPFYALPPVVPARENG